MSARERRRPWFGKRRHLDLMPPPPVEFFEYARPDWSAWSSHGTAEAADVRRAIVADGVL